MAKDALKSLEAAREAVTAELSDVRTRIAALKREAQDLRGAGPHPSEREALVAAHVETLRKKGTPQMSWGNDTLTVAWPSPNATVPVPSALIGTDERAVGGAVLLAWLDPETLCTALLRDLDEASPPDRAGPPIVERTTRLTEIQKEMNDLNARSRELENAQT